MSKKLENPKTREAPVAQAIARHIEAQAAIDAVADDPDGDPEHLNKAEFAAIDELAATPCASDAEFIEKLRYLHAYETRFFGVPTGQHEFRSVVFAVDTHFATGNEWTRRLRYRIWKLLLVRRRERRHGKPETAMPEPERQRPA